jgi:hypothetical protein
VRPTPGVAKHWNFPCRKRVSLSSSIARGACETPKQSLSCPVLFYCAHHICDLEYVYRAELNVCLPHQACNALGMVLHIWVPENLALCPACCKMCNYSVNTKCNHPGSSSSTYTRHRHRQSRGIFSMSLRVYLAAIIQPIDLVLMGSGHTRQRVVGRTWPDGRCCCKYGNWTPRSEDPAGGTFPS